MHLACGHSLRETAARARQAGIADVSVVALFKRLRKSKEWLRALCVGMYRECGVELGASEGFQVRAFDGSLVAEPGRTGSLWRVHYGLRLPALACDHFEVTRAKGEGCGETLKRFPIGRGDHVVADRGYSTAGGLMHVEAAGGYAAVRVNTRSLRFRTPGGRRPFDLLAAVSTLKRAGSARSWRARAVGRDGKGVVGRVCAMKKSAEDARQAREKLRRRAVHKGRELQPEPGGAVPGGSSSSCRTRCAEPLNPRFPLPKLWTNSQLFRARWPNLHAAEGRRCHNILIFNEKSKLALMHLYPAGSIRGSRLWTKRPRSWCSSA